jgi:DNA primase
MRLLVTILENIFGEIRKHNEDKGQISFDCPACAIDKNKPNGDGSGNLEINYEKGVFKCWVCKDTNNMSGHVFKLLKLYASEKDIRDYKLLCPTEFKSVSVRQAVVELPAEYIALSAANKFYFKYDAAINYLRKRGITDEQIDYYKIGYAPTGKYFNRIIFPSYNTDGLLNYFTGRWFSHEYTKMKYLNVEADKELIIFNEYRVRWDSTIYLVEGPADHIVTPNSIPLLGKYISDVLLEALMEKAQSYVVILLDGDAMADILILYKKLNVGRLRNKIKICPSNTEWDPSLVFQHFGHNGIVNLLKTSRKPTDAELYLI